MAKKKEKVEEKKEEVEGKEVGKVFSFYKKIKVAALKLSGKLKKGDKPEADSLSPLILSALNYGYKSCG